MNEHQRSHPLGPTAVPAPFCRRAELADMVHALRAEASHAVFLTADTGLGASTILRQLALEAAAEVPVAMFHGTSSLHQVPYGALAAHANTAGLGDVHTAVLRSVLQELRRQQQLLPGDPTERPLLIVDDGHFLDDASAEVLLTLVQSGTVNLVVSHTSRLRLPEPLTRLWVSGVAEYLVLQPLDWEAAHLFCEALLGGPILAASSRYYWTAAAGNPLFLRLLVGQAVEQGYLRWRRGLWIGNQMAPTHGVELRDAVHGELWGLSAPAQEALRLVALAEPVLDTVLEQLVGSAALQELLDWPLLSYRTAPSRLVGLSKPLYSDVIRGLVPLGQSRRLYERLHAVPETEPVGNKALLRRILWAVGIGEDVSEQQILWAAVHASKSYQPAVALELAEHVRSPEFALRAATLRARARFSMGDFAGASAELLAAGRDPDSVQEFLFVGLLRAVTKAAVGMPVAELVADAAALRRRGRELAAADPDHAEALRGCSEAVALLVDFLVHSREGNFAALGDLTVDLTHRDDLPEVADTVRRALVLTVESERLTAQGYPDQGMARAAEAYGVKHSEDTDVFFIRESILLRLMAAAMCAGDWDEAARVVDEFTDEASRVVFSLGGGAHVMRGMALLRAGQAAEALTVLRESMSELALGDPQHLLGMSTAMAAYAAAQKGQTQLAHQLLDGYVPGQGLFVVLAHERVNVAAARFLLNGAAARPEELLGLASTAAAAGLGTLELNALVTAWELGDTEVIPRIAELAARVEGRWAHAVHCYAVAWLADDGQQLAEAGATLQEAGLLGFAGQALERSVTILGAAGSRDAVRDARIRLRDVSDGLGVPYLGKTSSVAGSLGLLPTAVAVAELTRREREISSLAAGGRSDRQIADTLMLSLRTVEGHLYRAYAKLGISGRDGLPAAIAEHDAS